MRATSLSQVLRRRSIGAITIVLLICWPTDIIYGEADNCTSEVPTNWIKMEIPLYYTIAVGGLLLVTFVGCTTCLCYSRRRKEFFTDEARTIARPDNTWQLEVTPRMKEGQPDGKTLKELTKNKPNADCPTDNVSVQSNNRADEKKFNEEPEIAREDEELEQNRQYQADVKVKGTGMAAIDHAEQQEDIVCKETDMVIGNKKTPAAVDGSLLVNSSVTPWPEPVYTKVNKSYKITKTQASGYNIVYAELADFDKGKSEASPSRGNPSPVEYAEIARLTKSPRDMCPLDDC